MAARLYLDLDKIPGVVQALSKAERDPLPRVGPTGATREVQVKAHTRHLKTGGTVQVAAHQTHVLAGGPHPAAGTVAHRVQQFITGGGVKEKDRWNKVSELAEVAGAQKEGEGYRFRDQSLLHPEHMKDVQGPPTSAGKPAAMPTPGRAWVEALPDLPAETHKAFGTEFDEDGVATKYNPERTELHEAIIAHYLKKGKKPEDGQPGRAIMMMGGTASGKTSATKHVDKHGLVPLDADGVKEFFPEYQTAIPGNARNAAFMAHEESSYVMKLIRERALSGGMHILMDGTGAKLGGPKGYAAFAQRLKAAGYHVTLLMTDLDKESALKRSATRAERCGRFVPEHFIHHADDAIPPNFIPMTNEADDFELVNTRTDPPKTVWSRYNGAETIHDPEFVQTFRARYGKHEEGVMHKAEPTTTGPPVSPWKEGEVAGWVIDAMKAEETEMQKLPAQFPKDDGVRMIEDDKAAE